MIKKKKSIELSNKDIIFNIEKKIYKAIRYYPTSMNLDVMEYDENNIKVGVTSIAFTHIPREIKKMIKPN